MRVGKTKQPSYRVVVADSRSPRDGRIIEAIGHYQPRNDPSVVKIDTDRAQYWIDQGAQPSNQVKKLIQIASSPAEATPTADAATKATPAKTAPTKATPAASIKATPAASVSEEEVGDEVPADQEPAEVPEAEDQEAAAPEAT